MIDSRITQAQQLIKEARTLITGIELEGGHVEVDRLRLQQVHKLLTQSLSASEWFTRRYPDERDGA